MDLLEFSGTATIGSAYATITTVQLRNTPPTGHPVAAAPVPQLCTIYLANKTGNTGLALTDFKAQIKATSNASCPYIDLATGTDFEGTSTPIYMGNATISSFHDRGTATNTCSAIGVFDVCNAEVLRFQAISTTNASATASVTVYGCVAIP